MNICWSNAERDLVKAAALDIFFTPAWSRSYFKAVQQAQCLQLPESRRRTLNSPVQVLWAHPLYSPSLVASVMCEEMRLPKTERLEEYFSSSTKLSFNAWLHEQATAKKYTDVQQPVCQPAPIRGASEIAEPQKPVQAEGLEDAIRCLTEQLRESNDLVRAQLAMLGALPNKLSIALHPLSLNLVNVIDALQPTQPLATLVVPDPAPVDGTTVVPEKFIKDPVKQKPRSSKPRVLVVGLLPHQALEIRLTFERDLELKFLESYTPNTEAIVKNVDRIFGCTKFMSHSMDAVLSKTGGSRYSRFCGSTSMLKSFLHDYVKTL